MTVVVVAAAVAVAVIGIGVASVVPRRCVVERVDSVDQVLSHLEV